MLTSRLSGFDPFHDKSLANGCSRQRSGNLAERNLETTKTEQARILEESKAEAARILEVIKTGNNSDKAAVNLKFLVDAGLISDPDRREK